MLVLMSRKRYYYKIIRIKYSDLAEVKTFRVTFIIRFHNVKDSLVCLYCSPVHSCPPPADFPPGSPHRRQLHWSWWYFALFSSLYSDMMTLSSAVNMEDPAGPNAPQVEAHDGKSCPKTFTQLSANNMDLLVVPPEKHSFIELSPSNMQLLDLISHLHASRALHEHH